MDIRMPVMDGLEATRWLLAAPGGFLLNDAPAADLIAAIRIVAAGDALLSPAVTKRLIANFVRSAPPATVTPPALEVLTEREREVLRLITKGLSNREIAADLVLSEQTVKTYVGRIFAKLHLRDRPQAIVLAYETGLVTPAGP